MKLLVYSILRLLVFVVPFVIMWQFAIFKQLPWLAAIFSAIIGLCLSILFLRKPLNEATTAMASHRAPKRSAADEDFEDDVVDQTAQRVEPKNPTP